MIVRKFQAANLREALTKIKSEMGSEAVIVATKEVRRGVLGSGVEVTAAIEGEEPAGPAAALTPPLAPPAPKPVPAPTLSMTDADIERMMAPMRSELRSLRSMLRSVSSSQTEALVRKELAALRQEISEIRVGAGVSTPDLASVAANHEIAAPSEGRIVVVVGPTGVGKTTTIAKLAARAALLEGRTVAIFTLDTYRVGGEEQIRTFADLIGVPLVLLPDPSQLRTALQDFSHFDRIYIDTAGRSPRDTAAILALQTVLPAGADVEVHIALPASAHSSLIDSCMQRYRPLNPDRLLFTKLDECDDLRELVLAPARVGVPISFVTTGQRIPEDLENATTENLLSFGLKGFAAQELR